MAENKTGSARAQRLAPHRFVAGQSGNPGGRPKRSAIKDYFEEGAKEGGNSRLRIVMEVLFHTAIDRKHRDHIKAIELVTGYCFGRPTQALEVGDPDGGPLSVAPMLEAKLGAMLDALAAQKEEP